MSGRSRWSPPPPTVSGCPPSTTCRAWAEGDVAGVTRRWLDGAPPVVRLDPANPGWPLPLTLAGLEGRTGGGLVTVTDAARPPRALEVLLRPASLVVGVGSSTGADPDQLWSLAVETLAGAGVSLAAIGEIATLDRKAAEPAIVALAARLGVTVRTFDAAALAGVVARGAVPNPSDVVEAAVGTASVAEAAAILAAGPGSVLVATKQIAASRDATLAVSRRARPAGDLAVVGLGPGEVALRTPAASAAVRHAEVVSGYGPYVDLAVDLLHPGQVVLRWPIGAENDRCRDALQRAAAGARVALVCSGDAGVYALASLVCELAPAAFDPPVTVVPGVTAALSGAAVLGGPLGHDHVAISLSDLLTPWALIVRRLHAAAAGDFVVSLYNPRSLAPHRATGRGPGHPRDGPLAVHAGRHPDRHWAVGPGGGARHPGQPGPGPGRHALAGDRRLHVHPVDRRPDGHSPRLSVWWRPAGPGPMTIRLSDGCTACGACLITCPTGALTAAPFRPAVNAGRCTDCLACVEVCPADAIVLVPAGTPGTSLPSPARIRP